MMGSFNNIMLLLIAGLPIIYANQPALTISETQFASINDLVTLRCSLSYKKHLPEDTKIEWFDGPLPIKSGVNGVTIEYITTDAKMESLINIDQVKNFHFGQYKCKAEGLTASTLLVPKGTTGKNFITHINLTHPEQVQLKCSNIPSDNSNNVSWKKVQFDQTVISLDAKTNSFNGTVSSLSETGKFICHNDNTVFHISYVYPQDYQPLKFTGGFPNNLTLVYNSIDRMILLTCKVPLSTGPTKLYWMFNNEQLTSDVVKRVDVPAIIEDSVEYQLQLIIRYPIPMMDTGTYTCVAENEWEKIERYINVRFDIPHVDPYNILAFDTQEYMIDGSEFTASCMISRINQGIQLNVVMYYTDGSTFTPLMNDANTLIQYTVQNYMIIAKATIKKATIKHKGTYFCYVASFAGNIAMKQTTPQFIQRPAEIVNYYKDPIEQHSITCKAHIFVSTLINCTTIQFTHHLDHHHRNKVYHPTSTFVNETDKTITAHLDLKIVHGQRYHGVYECITSTSLPEKVYNDTRSLSVEQAGKQKESSLAFSVQSSTDDSSSSNDTQIPTTVCIIAGVIVFVVATAVLLVIMVHQRLRRSRNNFLNEPQHV